METEIEIDGEWEWGRSNIGQAFCKFESLLRCTICSELLRNPSSLPCGHNFCSECIRKHMDQVLNPTTSSKCPSCKRTIAVADLRPSKEFEAVVIQYKKIRPVLLPVVQNNLLNDYQVGDLTEKPQSETTMVTRRLPMADFHKQPKEKVRIALENLTASTSVKLRADGDKSILEKRYRDFVHLHNAQLDSSIPLSIEEIVKEVTHRENEREKKSNKFRLTHTNQGNIGFAQLKKRILDNRLQIPSNYIASECRDRQQQERLDRLKMKQHGSWVAVWSSKLKTYYFYNIKSEKGQLTIPEELKSIYMRSSKFCPFKTHLNENSCQIIEDILKNENQTTSTRCDELSKFQLLKHSKDDIADHYAHLKFENDTKICSFCTFINNSNAVKCEICLNLFQSSRFKNVAQSSNKRKDIEKANYSRKK